MRILDLFSGIGGFSVGLHRAGMTTAAFCEADERCRKVLRRHWPGTPIFEDVRTLKGAAVGAIDVVCGGFPCQDLSPAGKRVGLSGERSGLWSEYARIVRELDAKWIVIENAGHTWRRWVPAVRRDLWAAGYASLPLRVRASDVGAKHERARGIVIAHTDSELLRQLQGWWVGPGREVAAELAESWDSAPRGLGADDGAPDWVDRRRMLGNAVVTHVAELIGRGIMAHNVVVSG